MFIIIDTIYIYIYIYTYIYIYVYIYLIVKEMSFCVFTLLDLDDYASERARALSDDDMIMLKTLRFYHDQMSMQDPVPAGK